MKKLLTILIGILISINISCQDKKITDLTELASLTADYYLELGKASGSLARKFLLTKLLSTGTVQTVTASHIWADNAIVKLGAGTDGQVYSDGTDMIIKLASNNLKIQDGATVLATYVSGTTTFAGIISTGASGGTSGKLNFIMSDNDLFNITGTTSDQMTFNDASGGYIFDDLLQVGDFSGNPVATMASNNGTSRFNFYDAADGSEGASMRVLPSGQGAKMHFANRWTADTDRVTFDLTNGFVGIKTTTPSEELHVVGNILAIDTVFAPVYTNTSDFVLSESGSDITINADTTVFPDDNFLGIGTGKDLEIYHTTNANFIKANNGDVLFGGSSATGTFMRLFNATGVVELRHNGNTRLSTSAAGVTVNGDITIGNLDTFNAGSFLTVFGGNDANGKIDYSGADAFVIQSDEAINLENVGNITMVIGDTGVTTDNGGFIDASGGFKDAGTAGVDGTFEDNNSNTVTVSGGIITNLTTAPKPGQPKPMSKLEMQNRINSLEADNIYLLREIASLRTMMQNIMNNQN